MKHPPPTRVEHGLNMMADKIAEIMSLVSAQDTLICSQIQNVVFAECLCSNMCVSHSLEDKWAWRGRIAACADHSSSPSQTKDLWIDL